ncbi:MAG TPA: hypothetical protein ENG42_03220 [Candidatus Aenigmarchaeota archaeon]|nr:hypothetical protein [Candidatus Aenigmarchaeota archaeon]
MNHYDVLYLSCADMYRELVLAANLYGSAIPDRQLGYIMGELDDRRDEYRELLYTMEYRVALGKKRKRFKRAENEAEVVDYIIESNPLYLRELERKDPKLARFCREYLQNKRRYIKRILKQQAVDCVMMRNMDVIWHEPCFASGRIKMPMQTFYKIAKKIIGVEKYEKMYGKLDDEEKRRLVTPQDFLAIRWVWHTKKGKLEEDELDDAIDKLIAKVVKLFPFYVREEKPRGTRRKARFIPTDEIHTRTRIPGFPLDIISAEFATLEELYDRNVVPHTPGNKTHGRYEIVKRSKVYFGDIEIELDDKELEMVKEIFLNTLKMMGVKPEDVEKVVGFRYFREILRS